MREGGKGAATLGVGVGVEVVVVAKNGSVGPQWNNLRVGVIPCACMVVVSP